MSKMIRKSLLASWATLALLAPLTATAQVPSPATGQAAPALLSLSPVSPARVTMDGRSAFVQQAMTGDGLTFRAVRAQPEMVAPGRRPTSHLVAGGLAGGAAGALAGGLIAAGVRALGPCDDQDGCLDQIAEWGVSGAFIGESLLLPVGVHIANGRQGRTRPAILASAAIGAAGLAGYHAVRHYGTDDWGNERGNLDLMTALIVVATPVLQLITSTAIERRPAR